MGEETYIIAHKIGFIKEDYESKETEQKREVVRGETIARKSVVQVYFPERNQTLTYPSCVYHINPERESQK